MRVDTVFIDIEFCVYQLTPCVMYLVNTDVINNILCKITNTNMICLDYCT